MVSQCGTACLIRNSRLPNDIRIQNDVVATVPPANDSPLSDSLRRIAPSRPTGTFKYHVGFLEIARQPQPAAQMTEDAARIIQDPLRFEKYSSGCSGLSQFHHAIESVPIVGQDLLLIEIPFHPRQRTTHIHNAFASAPIYYEENHRFYPEVISLPSSCTIRGDFQSGKYFKPIAGTLRRELTLKNYPLARETVTMQRRIAHSESVSVHVRRGNYLNAPRCDACTLKYYQKAVQHMQESLRNPIFYTFFQIMHQHQRVRTRFSKQVPFWVYS